MKKNMNQIFLAVILLLIGIIIAIQIRSVQKYSVTTNRQKDLVKLKELVELEKQRSGALAEQLKGYKKEIEKHESEDTDNKELSGLKAELASAKLYAGLTDVKGNGIIITLDDSKKRAIEGLDPNDTIIHDWQLAETVNILREAGAQAISINDERITATSEIQCAGPTVSINNIRYAVPFIIKAIGDADYLEAKLKEHGNVLDLMSIYGINIDVKKQKGIVIQKYLGTLNGSEKMVEVGEMQ